jgi:large subunit ribosomal protein L24
MDKILRRVHMAERLVARRAKRRQALDHSIAASKTRQAVNSMRQEAGHDLGAAIKLRHEDLELGPLAPRRDVAKINPYGNYWGSISTERALLQTKITKEQREARAAWAGGAEYLCLKEGDRVVITEGPYKGKISTIGSLKKETMTVELDDNVAIVSRQLVARRPRLYYSAACSHIRNRPTCTSPNTCRKRTSRPSS